MTTGPGGDDKPIGGLGVEGVGAPVFYFDVDFPNLGCLIVDGLLSHLKVNVVDNFRKE